MTLPLLLLLLGSRAQADVPTILIHADQPGHPISRDLFGVFFEEINHAGDGGLNPELVRNFNFHEPLRDNQMPGWTVIGNGTAGAVLTGIGEMDIERTAPGDQLAGASNAGYWGIPVSAGARYRYNVTCKSATGAPIVLRLIDSSGKDCGSANLTPSGAISDVKGVIKATATDHAAHLEIGLVKAGKVGIKGVSLQPVDTWKGHGLRNDLAGLVDGLHPAFVRFPGGCYVEGGDYLADRFKWDTTLVDPVQRPGHRNATWGYWSSDGLGYHEYLQWCEDMHADALFVVNCGFSHKETVPTDKLDEYLVNAMYAIEYALGPADSRLGAIRAQRGHAAPFPLK